MKDEQRSDLKIVEHTRQPFETTFYVGKVMIYYGLLIALTKSFYIGLCLVVVGLIVVYVAQECTRPPINQPANYLRKKKRKYGQNDVLVCLGGSMTHGVISANYVDAIPKALCKKAPFQDFFLDVVNAGQNGIASWTTYTHRLDNVVACDPDFVSILLGTNDVKGMIQHKNNNNNNNNKNIKSNGGNGGEGSDSSSSSSSSSISNTGGWDLLMYWREPTFPTLDSYEQNMDNIVRRLEEETRANIALYTLPPIGEQLDSDINNLIRKANERIARIASNHDRCTMLPLYEELSRQITKATTNANKQPLGLATNREVALIHVCHFLFGISYQTIGDIMGRKFMFDNVHLNERGRDIAVHLLTDWLLGLEMDGMDE